MVIWAPRRVVRAGPTEKGRGDSRDDSREEEGHGVAMRRDAPPPLLLPRAAVPAFCAVGARALRTHARGRPPPPPRAHARLATLSDASICAMVAVNATAPTLLAIAALRHNAALRRGDGAPQPPPRFVFVSSLSHFTSYVARPAERSTFIFVDSTPEPFWARRCGTRIAAFRPLSPPPAALALSHACD